MKPTRTLRLLAAAALAALLSACTPRQTPYPYEYLYENLPFDMPRIEAPAFPPLRVSLADFGAAGDGSTLCTEAFERAIEHLSSRGGGHLDVPAGVWLTGPIVLRSRIDLHLEAGALIRFSPDIDLYPLVETVFEGLDTKRCQSPISGRGLENVAITGSGIIDGNGSYWRPVNRDKVTESEWQEVLAREGGVLGSPDFWYPSEEYLRGRRMSDMNVPTQLTTDEEFLSIKPFLRPVMVSLIECRNVWLSGVVFQNSPAWNLHPLMCENLLIENITVRNPSYAQNGDGIDLESCRNTLIVDSRFDVGDDGICIKSGKDEDGRRRARACENLIVDGCSVFRGHGGFVVGSEMSGGVRNMYVSRCQFIGTDAGLRFKSKRGRGGVVENIWIKDIAMADIPGDGIIFNLHYNGTSPVEKLLWGVSDPDDDIPALPVDETTPAFRNIRIDGVSCIGARRALYFNGLPEMPIEGITISRSRMTSRLGAEFAYCRGIALEDVRIENTEGEKVSVRHCQQLTGSVE